MIGKTISHYKILEKLGEGGMGVVYKAEDTKLKRDVAIKFLPRQVAAQSEERERFIIEAQAAAALNHPNITTIYAIEEVDDKTFIVMEYIEGQELRGVIYGAVGVQNFEPLPIDQTIQYATQIAAGLQAAHEKGIVHRDIKPANIMIDTAGQVKIMDFGLAKIAHGTLVTKAGFTLGTVAYMSPEQSCGDFIDPRTDIWSLGVVLYEMLTGDRPFKGHYEQAVVYSILNEEPVSITKLNPGVPPDLAALVMKALQRQPEDRYQNMSELIADLKMVGKQSETTNSRISPPEEKQSLAISVLPFRDLSPQKDQDYFCDGMTEEIIDALAKIARWRVVSRTSVFTFKGKETDIRTIGEQLNVSHALEGSVRKAGNRLRITVKLINVKDGFQLWSEKYDRELDDIFAVQDDITRMIVEKLRIELGDEKEVLLVKHYTENLVAYNLYLQARFHLNKRTEAGLKKGVDFCHKALTTDPDYALAYSGLADGFILLSFQGFLSPGASLPKAQKAAEKALSLDSSLAEAHCSLGCVQAVYHRNWSESEKHFKRTLELNANAATAHYWYAIWYLLPTGQFERCLTEINKAQELDPLSLVLNTGIGWQFYFAREYDRAIDALQKVLNMDCNFIFARDILGQAYEQKGLGKQAVAEIEKAVKLSNRRTLSLSALAHVYATAGRLADARKILAELLERAKKEYVSAYDIALVHASLHEEEQAFDWLARAYEEHSGWLIFLAIEPRFDSLRTDQRFTALLQKVGLAE